MHMPCRTADADFEMERRQVKHANKERPADGQRKPTSRPESGAAEDGFPPIDLTYAMTQRSFLFPHPARLHTGMKYTAFSEWLADRDEGLSLPDRPPLRGMPKINATPNTDAQRKRLHPKKVKPPKLFKPTVRAVKETVPNKLIPKVKPMTPLKPRSPLG